jgi:hypothetical protein
MKLVLNAWLAVNLLIYHAVTFTRGFFQSFPVSNIDLASLALNDAFALECACRHRDIGTWNSEHLCD